MERLPRKIYTYEFKMEAVRLVEPSQSVAEAARSLGVIEQTLSNWIKAHKAGKLTANGRGSRWSATYCEKPRRTSPGARDEVRLHLQESPSLASLLAV